ncbi:MULTISPECIES: HAD family hydrolase [Collinsella]|uniref:HAD family hydrolase n=1 Tax=Collinsella TaxID=102106 RepID=UPI001F15972B|nr:MULTISPECIES: HAD hydrolase family protein [Collinsella]
MTGRRVCRRSSKRAQQANRELSPKGIDKGVGVARALEYLGREGNARTFGFGDSGNDLGMLAAVETAVAMGNAMPEVKALADYVTDDVVHDGTVTAMQHFGLI